MTLARRFGAGAHRQSDAMKAQHASECLALEDIPNIGPALAGWLKRFGSKGKLMRYRSPVVPDAIGWASRDGSAFTS